MVLSRKIVTIDGLSGSGKSAISKQLGLELGVPVLNSGLLYRSLARYMLDSGEVDFDSESSVAGFVEKIRTVELVESKQIGGSCVLVDGQPITGELYSPEMSEATSKVSKCKAVRELLLGSQREAYPEQTIIAEGRDMGSVIFPEADIKFFVDCPAEVRAERRLGQMLAKPGIDPKVLKLQLEREINERDRRDLERENSPAVVPDGAIRVDNSSQPLTKVIESMYAHLSKIGLTKKSE